MSDTLKDENKEDLDKKQTSVSILDNISGLFSNNYHTFVVRKAERLASALYVITGFMPVEEPARTRLRVCALELITRSTNPSELAEKGPGRFESCCTEIGTILQTAQYAGLVSAMNAKLIAEEYAALASFVRSHSDKIGERGYELHKSTVSEPKTVSSPMRHSNKSLLKGFPNIQKTSYRKKEESLNERKTLILSLFDKKQKISIRDAVSTVPGVSEKTVQRDLLTLVHQGVLVKEGSRRWTTYRKG